MIEVSGLHKAFAGRPVVRDLTFCVQPGEVVGFLGPNGAGKSTTMKMLTGFLRPDAGWVRLCGLDMARQAIRAQSVLGYLPEGAPCYGEMQVGDFLTFIAKVRGYSGRDLSGRVERALDLLELHEVREQRIETLSKGFNRRVGLAQAVLHDPQVLILDEPTDGLDPNQKHQVRELIRQLAPQRTILVSTHILEEVTALCSRVLLIAEGCLLTDATPLGLQQQSRYWQAVTLRGNGLDRALLEQLPGVQEVEVDAMGGLTLVPEAGRQIYGQVSALAREQGWELEQLSVEAGRLDEVFRRLTRGGQA